MVILACFWGLFNSFMLLRCRRLGVLVAVVTLSSQSQAERKTLEYAPRYNGDSGHVYMHLWRVTPGLPPLRLALLSAFELL